jgi:hypothetical protein
MSFNWDQLQLLLEQYKAVRDCSKNVKNIFYDISSWTDYRYQLSIFWNPLIIFRYDNNLRIIFILKNTTFNILGHRYMNGSCSYRREAEIWGGKKREKKEKSAFEQLDTLELAANGPKNINKCFKTFINAPIQQHLRFLLSPLC